MDSGREVFMEPAAGEGRLTLYRETAADMETPVSILSKLMGRKRAVLLESAKEDKTYSRFSFLAFDMDRRLDLTEKDLCDEGALTGMGVRNGSPRAEFGDFQGGYVGYLNYEFVGACDTLRKPMRNADMPH